MTRVSRWYTVGAAAALVLALGWWRVVALLFCSTTIVLLATLCLRHMYEADQLQLHVFRARWPPRTCVGLASVVRQMDAQQSSSASLSAAAAARVDVRYTGSSVVDQQLRQVLELAVRDYVLPWYGTLSPDGQFVRALHALVQAFIVQAAARAKQVDWVPWIVGRLVDELVHHLRMYRRARHRTHCHALADDSDDQEEGDRGDARLVDAFFQLEALEDRRRVCRRAVCTGTPQQQRRYLHDISSLLLHKLTPRKDQSCTLLHTAGVQLLSQLVLWPLLRQLSSPDYLNRLLVHACCHRSVGGSGGAGQTLTSQALLECVRASVSRAELSALSVTVQQQLTDLRSQDSAARPHDEAIRQQLSSLAYVRRLIESRLDRLERRRAAASATSVTAAPKSVELPLRVLLSNNVALSHLLDFLATIGEQQLLFFHLNVDGWCASVVEHRRRWRRRQRQRPSNDPMSPSALPEQPEDGERQLREAAASVLDQALAAQPALPLDAGVVRRLSERIASQTDVTERWFDEAHAAVLARLASERVYVAFCRSPAYARLVAELDLSRAPSSASVTSSSSSSGDNDDGGDRTQVVGAAESSSTAAELDGRQRRMDTRVLVDAVAQEAGRSYTVYSVVVRVCDTGDADDSAANVWTVLRRYSDFHELRERLLERRPQLARLPFPGKRAFNNLTPTFVERRRRSLDIFLRALVDQYQQEQPQSHPQQWWSLVLQFLESGEYRRGGGGGGSLGRAVDSLVTPLRVSLRAVDDVVGGLSRALRGPNTSDSDVDSDEAPTRAGGGGGAFDTAGGVGFDGRPSLLTDGVCADSTPLHIVLLLLEEVFDVRARGQWLRRRLVPILRQLVRAMYGDSVSRRINDFLAELTCPERVSGYVRAFKNHMWPNGGGGGGGAARDSAMRRRTRLVARVCLLSSISDELRHILGGETTRRGVLLVVDMLQNTQLNRRLVLVVLESVLELLLPECDLTRLVDRLHAATASPERRGQC